MSLNSGRGCCGRAALKCQTEGFVYRDVIGRPLREFYENAQCFYFVNLEERFATERGFQLQNASRQF